MSDKPTGPSPLIGARERRLTWLFILALAMFCALAIDILGVALKTLQNAYYTGDFTVFWAAARAPVDQVYDWAFLERSQLEAIGEVGPFSYPPTTLLWLKPFGLALPFPLALGAWLAVGLTAFFVAARQVADVRTLLLASISPAIVIAAATGQLSLIVGALALGGMTARPPLAKGAMIGLAAAIKPQLLFLFPVAFVAAGEWRAMSAAVAALTASVAATLILWGVQPWADWLSSLPQFEEVLRDTGIGLRSVTPASLFLPLGLEWPVALVGLLAGAALVWIVHRRISDPRDRIAALLVGCLLSLPYALSYDMAALVILVVPTLFDRKGSILGWTGAGMIFCTVGEQVGLILYALELLRRTKRPARPEPGAALSEA